MGLVKPLLCNMTYSRNATPTVPQRARFPLLLLKLHLFVRDSSAAWEGYSALVILLLPCHCHTSAINAGKTKDSSVWHVDMHM